ncbi:hypothetical protein GUITHDRAFT_121383 [Guillardia theta CCMP2712]|uniref:PDZ domain-containing protein n=1 Tax=Guillardia theta (strain CCMP2712) TaxID=905079 RepID=L1I896_GUITC|nr:hypothetical protein GUITHDRAFT_121383 [Guillardia theta CCMP2712]EKX32453.1 hypothetical protein GUITHDRAFT_121383 [Guillardia theta CCMP2712]|eukprot:XP_005819433.1 hypothetical protein GUITHDRAFT_121383 [Guillardia theta CCMP2712]
MMYKKIERHNKMQKIAGVVGLRLRVENKEIGWVVVEVVEDMAGDKAGMKMGDCIQEVDGLPVKEAQSVQIIRGPVGSKVTLKVVRGLKQALVEVEKDKQVQERRRKQMESLKEDATKTSRFEEIKDSTDDDDQVTNQDDSNADETPEILEIVLTRESGKKNNPISKPRFDGPEQEAKKDQ